jgi:hypothetical protein
MGLESLLPLVAEAKLSSVAPVAMIVMICGGLLSLVGFLWLVFQNSRFSVVNGVIGFLIPLWALIYGFFGMEHRHKSLFITLFVAGGAVAGLGSFLYAANQACENDIRCGIRDLSIIEEGGEAQESDDQSSLYQFSLDFLSG